MKTVKIVLFTVVLGSATACMNSERNHPIGSRTEGASTEPPAMANDHKTAKAPGTLGGESYNFGDSVRR